MRSGTHLHLNPTQGWGDEVLVRFLCCFFHVEASEDGQLKSFFLLFFLLLFFFHLSGRRGVSRGRVSRRWKKRTKKKEAEHCNICLDDLIAIRVVQSFVLITERTYVGKKLFNRPTNVPRGLKHVFSMCFTWPGYHMRVDVEVGL